MMKHFKNRRNVIVVGTFLLLTMAILMLPAGNRARVQRGFLGLISPFLRKGSDWDRQYHDYKDKLRTLKQLEEDNTRLTSDVGRLLAENQALRGVEAENLKLKAALGYQSQVPFTLVPARVIGRPVSNWWSTIKVDKGSDDGVMADVPVVTADGLAGKVIEVWKDGATVLLVTDENCKVAANVEGSKSPDRQGIVHVEVRGERAAGPLQPEMRLSFISKYASLQPGQRILTSGAGGVYPAGIMLGKVASFKSGVLDGQAVVEPSVDLTMLSDVFIITGMKGAAKQ